MNRTLLILCLSMLLGACSSTDEIELEPAELVDFDESARLKTLWRKGVGAGQDARYTRLVPAVVADSVYAAGIEGQVSAFSRMTGAQQWSTDLEESISAGTGAGFGLVLVGTYKGEVIALDQETGSERWRSQLSSEVLAPPPPPRD